MRDAYAIVCLVLGGALVVGQLVATVLEARRSAQVSNAAGQVERAAARTAAAAATTCAAVQALPDPARVTQLLGGQVELYAAERALAEQAGVQAAAAEKDAAAAEGAAKSAATQYDVAAAVAAKAPLAVAGIVLLALGALIAGLVDLTASATAGG